MTSAGFDSSVDTSCPSTASPNSFDGGHDNIGSRFKNGQAESGERSGPTRTNL